MAAMKILEILDTKPDVHWDTNGHLNRGTFDLGDGNKYVIQIDEYEVLGKTLVDFGFTTNNSIDLVDSGKNSAKIIGGVLNGSISKIKELDPDVILISILKTSGGVPSRKKLYTTLASFMFKKIHFHFQTEWNENDSMFFKIISKEKLSNEELKVFGDQVKAK